MPLFRYTSPPTPPNYRFTGIKWLFACVKFFLLLAEVTDGGSTVTPACGDQRGSPQLPDLNILGLQKMTSFVKKKMGFCETSPYMNLQFAPPPPRPSAQPAPTRAPAALSKDAFCITLPPVPVPQGPATFLGVCILL